VPVLSTKDWSGDYTSKEQGIESCPEILRACGEYQSVRGGVYRKSCAAIVRTLHSALGGVAGTLERIPSNQNHADKHTLTMKGLYRLDNLLP
jgi:hypothetical protein